MNSRTRWASLALAAAAFGGLLLVYPHTDATLFFRGYFFAFLCVLSVSLGSLALVMLHNLTGGAWGDAIRPGLHAATMTLPLVAVLFIPVALSLPALYPWAQADAAGNALLAHRAPYLNVPFFLARAVGYFVIWIALALLLHHPRRLNRGLNAGGLILYLLTMTHAGYDWIMSRDTDFYSTAFGFVVTLGQTLAALALAILLMRRRPDGAALHPPARPEQTRGLFNDLGNVLLTVVILWTYVSFMEFLVIWMGNSRDDNSWFTRRGLSGGTALSDESGPWRLVAVVLIFFHFFVPFYLLLFRSVKQRGGLLAAIAGLLLAAHVVEVYWLVAPSGESGRAFHPTPADACALIAVAGLWLFVYLTLRARRPTWQPPLAIEEVPVHG